MIDQVTIAQNSLKNDKWLTKTKSNYNSQRAWRINFGFHELLRRVRQDTPVLADGQRLLGWIAAQTSQRRLADYSRLLRSWDANVVVLRERDLLRLGRKQATGGYLSVWMHLFAIGCLKVEFSLGTPGRALSLPSLPDPLFISNSNQDNLDSTPTFSEQQILQHTPQADFTVHSLRGVFTNSHRQADSDHAYHPNNVQQRSELTAELAEVARVFPDVQNVLKVPPHGHILI